MACVRLVAAPLGLPHRHIHGVGCASPIESGGKERKKEERKKKAKQKKEAPVVVSVTIGTCILSTVMHR